MSLGISIKPTIGIGDALQYSSLPENYFRSTGEMLVDVSKPWFFDHNPFVIRDPKQLPTKITEMWNFSPTQYQWPKPRDPDQAQVYLSNAEIWASLFHVKPVLIRPRLYRFEDFPFEKRKMILLQTKGVSHGSMPEEIIEHIKTKYHKTMQLFHVGPGPSHYYGLRHIDTPGLWDLAELISRSRMFIGMDSGPTWIAACYPDVIVKKIRTKPLADTFQNWVPLEIKNIHSHWDERCHQIYNPTEKDIGFTLSYKRI